MPTYQEGMAAVPVTLYTTNPWDVPRLPLAAADQSRVEGFVPKGKISATSELQHRATLLERIRTTKHRRFVRNVIICTVLAIGATTGASGVSCDVNNAPVSDQSAAAAQGGSSHSELAAFMAAELMQESSGNWSAPPNGSNCSGGFQISDDMWNGHDGYKHASDDTPAGQSKFAKDKFESYKREFGDWTDVAKAWYAGEGFARDNQDAPQYGGPSINEYAYEVMNGANGNPGMKGYLNGATMPPIPGVS